MLVLATAMLAGCATLATLSFDERFGRADPTRFDAPRPPSAGVPTFHADVQPILERRCVVCHGCYDAPCQLKLTAWDGVARGQSNARVYDGARLLAAPPSRLFIDAQLPSQWRKLGFDPVLNEREASAEANLAGSVLYQSLALKARHPLPGDAVLGSGFDFSLDRAQVCPRIEQFDSFAKHTPLAGMPYGLPAVTDAEFTTLRRWIEAGSPYEGDKPLTAAQQSQVQRWEAFFNGDSNRERLMSRYLYEHLFLAQLYFDADRARRPFRLLRSATPPGTPVQPIATRRPYEDPGVPRVYYRLVPEQESILAKTHLPYGLGDERMRKYQRWFLAPGHEVTELPSYAPEVAANPFAAFAALPVESRYRFLLDEAQFFIMNFIKGPVCRGQVALNVIQDRFWVFFADPEFNTDDLRIDALLRQADALSLPSEEGSNAGILRPWLSYALQERAYQQKRREHAQRALRAAGATIDLDIIWNGSSTDTPGVAPNRNAALTVFRHFDNASVVQGLVGEPPKTAWVIGYSLFERIYYLLVAGYDVYGNIGHQLNSRLYMDFLRMEGESNFIALLPPAARRQVAEAWYDGEHDEAKTYLYGQLESLDVPNTIPYRAGEPLPQLYTLLQQRVGKALAHEYELDRLPAAALRAPLKALSQLRGTGLALLPEHAFLRVDDGTRAYWFTLLRNTGHRNITHLLTESRALKPEENTLTVVPGFIGAHPNALYRVAARDLPAFVQAMAAASDEAGYRRLADRFAVRRTAADFWEVSDALHAAYRTAAPKDAGWFDYNRLENR